MFKKLRLSFWTSFEKLFSITCVCLSEGPLKIFLKKWKDILQKYTILMAFKKIWFKILFKYPFYSLKMHLNVLRYILWKIHSWKIFLKNHPLWTDSTLKKYFKKIWKITFVIFKVLLIKKSNIIGQNVHWTIFLWDHNCNPKIL